MHRRTPSAPWRVAAIAVCATALLTACFPPTDADVAAVAKTVGALTPPTGWIEIEALDIACHPGHPGCEDDSSHRAFHSPGTVQEACAAVVAWVVASPTQFADPIAIVGADTKTPTAASCVSEINTVHSYIMNTGVGSGVAPGVPDKARWAMRLFPEALGGWRLSVVLGAPPRDPWKAQSEG